MADENQSLWQRMGWHRLAWLAGAVGLPLSHYWLVAKVEPFYSTIYCFLWWSYIFVVDFAVCQLRGNSLLRNRPREFLFLTAWSVPVWMLFEAVNLRLHNWYYVMAPWSLSWGMIFLLLAFATVLPGIFETMELVLALIEKLSSNGRITSRPFELTRSNLRLQWCIGALMLVLMLAFPGTCFCLAWGFVFFLTEPICYWQRRTEKNQVGRSLLGQIAAGDCTRLVALLVAGFICGGLWESWNFTARTKWIYSVPFFDELKVGEMPVLGFLGFPPFALECYALVNFLGLLRGGRHWELDPSENRARLGMPAWGVATSAIVSVIFILFCAVGDIEYTVASFAEPVDLWFQRELGASGVNALRQRNATEGDEFLSLKERPPEINPELYERMRQVVALSEFKGMGLFNAWALNKLNITAPGDLAQQNPLDLAEKLQERGLPVRVEEVKVWIQGAQRKNQSQSPSHLPVSVSSMSE